MPIKWNFRPLESIHGEETRKLINSAPQEIKSQRGFDYSRHGALEASHFFWHSINWISHFFLLNHAIGKWFALGNLILLIMKRCLKRPRYKANFAFSSWEMFSTFFGYKFMLTRATETNLQHSRERLLEGSRLIMEKSCSMFAEGNLFTVNNLMWV